MTDPEILAGIAVIARAELDWRGELGAGQRLVEDLGLDSLKLLTLAVAVENRFRIRLTAAEEAEIATVGDLVAAVRRNAEADLAPGRSSTAPGD